jgi:hypothetical protein
VRTVLVQHCVNDAMDNVRSLGFHLGDWEIQKVERPRSWSHLMNLISYARMISNGPLSRAVGAGSDAGGADMQWAYQRKGAIVMLPDSIPLGGRTLRVVEETLRPALHSEDWTTLTPLQRDTMAGALNLLHAFSAKHNATVVHTFIVGTPDWYTNEVSALAKASAEFTGCRTLITAVLPVGASDQAAIRNTHAGGHFNARFSREWAVAVERVLLERQVNPR